MAEEQHQTTPTTDVHSADEIKDRDVHSADEITDRGLFDFLGKKEEEKPQEEVISTEMEKVHISEPVEETKVEQEEEEKKPSLLEKLHRSGSSSSSSSSSSEEEVEENGEKIKRKKNKGLKEKIKEKISGEKLEETESEKKPQVVVDEDTTTIPIEKYDHDVGFVTHEGEAHHPEEKKSFMEKIKEKLPGGSKKPEESAPPVADAIPVSEPTHVESPPAVAHALEAEPKEKKGILEKIKEKLPGYHKTEEEKKETTTATTTTTAEH